jgi:DNA repair exonuclease SbcCD ATPase subunit
MKLKLFASACPYLDQATSDHLKALDNAHLHVQFSTVKLLSSGDAKEDFNVRCWNDTGGEGFDSLSGGEQQIVSFAIGRALADLARTQTTGEYQFQILDEPFSMLDERNSENIVNYLKENIKAGTVLLISNEDQLKGLILNRINVIKKNGISEVIESA